MRNPTAAALLALALLPISAGYARAAEAHLALATQPQSPAPLSDAELRSRLERYLDAAAAEGFTGTVLVARKGTVLVEKGYGNRIPGQSSPVAADTVYTTGSITKQFTAAAILKLEEMGKLSVDDPISKFLSGVPADKRAITIHELLTHTSGMPSSYKAEGLVDRDHALAELLRQKLGSRPGEKYSYSNDGYNLLAIIVDLASGVGFDAFVLDSLLGPAGMERSGVWGRERPEVPIAALPDPRHTRGRLPTIYWDGHSVANWGYRGPGGVYATAPDLHRWIQALRSGGILDESSLRLMLGRHVLVREDSTMRSFSGYGWGVRVERGKDASYGHVGDDDWLGHNGVIRFTPEGGIVIVLSNSGEVDGEGWASRVNRAIRRVMDVPR